MTERPHQAKDNDLLIKPGCSRGPKKQHGPIADQIVTLLEVRSKQRLGGLLKHYYRQAA